MLRDDPAAGRTIVEDKKALWTTTAAAVEGADSAACQQLTGNNGRWEAAGTAVLRVGLMLPFPIVAAVFVVIAFVATRVFVPLAPGFGVVGLMYATQGWLLSVLKQVGRFVALGPLFFVGALANLLLATSTLDSDLAFPLQLVIVAGIPIVLFKLLRPRQAIPGSRTLGRLARTGLSTLVHGLATRKAVGDGIHDAKKGTQSDDEDVQTGRASLHRMGTRIQVPVRWRRVALWN